MRCILIVVVLVLAAQGFAMAVFGKKQDVVLASPLSGRIIYEQDSLVDVKVERIVEWPGGQSYRQEAATDSEGGFSFPSIVRELKVNPLNVLVVTQDISVQHGDKRKTVFSAATHGHQLYSEFGGEAPENFICDLVDADVPVRREGALILTLCKWKCP